MTDKRLKVLLIAVSAALCFVSAAFAAFLFAPKTKAEERKDTSVSKAARAAEPAEKFPLIVKAREPVACRSTPSETGQLEQTVYNNYPFRVVARSGYYLQEESSRCWIKASLVDPVGTTSPSDTAPPTDVAHSSSSDRPDPEALVNEQYQITLAEMGSADCGRLALQAAANSCVAQMYRNNSIQNGDYRRANGLAVAAASQINNRCPADIQMAYPQYSSRLFQRAYKQLAAQAPYAANASKIPEAGVEICTELAFSDLTQN